MARDNDLDVLQDLAERMQLGDEEADKFINTGMKRLGYKPRMDWDEPDDEQGKEKDDFFSEQRRTRRVGGNRDEQQRGQRRGGGGGDWQYGG